MDIVQNFISRDYFFPKYPKSKQNSSFKNHFWHIKNRKQDLIFIFNFYFKQIICKITLSDTFLDFGLGIRKNYIVYLIF